MGERGKWKEGLFEEGGIDRRTRSSGQKKKKKKRNKDQEKEQKTYGKSTSPPRRSSAHVLEVRKDGKGLLVPERHVDHAVVRERAHGGDAGRFLAAAGRGRRHEQAGVLAPEGAAHPLPARTVPEGLELAREVAVPGRDPEQEAVVPFHELGRGLGDRGVLARRVHLLEHFLTQRLGDTVFEREGEGSDHGWLVGWSR